MKWRRMERKIKGNVWTFKTLPVIAVADPNLVGWWTMDEGKGTRAVDWSGHGHHADFVGPAQWTPGYDGTALGPCGRAVSTSKRLAIPASWARRIVRAPPGSRRRRSATSWAGALGPTPRSGSSACRPTTGTRGASAWNARADGFAAGRMSATGNGTMWPPCSRAAARPRSWTSDSTWTACRKPISDSLSVDVNTVGGTRNVRIGDAHQNRPFPGVIDDARIYDKALTPEELAAGHAHRSVAGVGSAAAKWLRSWTSARPRR